MKILNCTDGPFYVCSFYRPPDKQPDYLSLLEKPLNKLYNKHKNKPPRIIIAGDLNYPAIDWNASIAPSQANGQCLLDILSRYHLEQMVTEPTFLRCATPHTLDLIITSHPELINNIIVGNQDFSDHCHITSDLLGGMKHVIKRKNIKLYKKANHDKIKLDLLQFEKEYLENASQLTVNDNWIKIKNAIKNTVDLNIPTKIINPNNKQNYSWINKLVKREIKLRNKLSAIYKRHPTDETFNKFKKQRNKTTNIVRNSYKHYAESLIGNVKKIHKIFTSF